MVGVGCIGIWLVSEEVASCVERSGRVSMTGEVGMNGGLV